MGISRILYRGIEKALKDPEESLEVKRKKIEDLFVRSVPDVPVGMVKELFAYYLTRTGGSVENLKNLAYHLVDVADLFSGEYDTRNNPLDEGEWRMIRDLTNAYAQDIDEDVLTYVMQLVIENGAFD